MRASIGYFSFLTGCFLITSFLLTPSASGQKDVDFSGWEMESDYNHHYKVTEQDQIKGTVEDIVGVTPLQGMTPGVGLSIRDQDGDIVQVHLGPKKFVNVDAIGLRKGDKVKIKGVWASVGGKEVFMASKLKKGENAELKLRRTKDGAPYWALSQDDLKKEHEE